MLGHLARSLRELTSRSRQEVESFRGTCSYIWHLLHCKPYFGAAITVIISHPESSKLQFLSIEIIIVISPQKKERNHHRFTQTRRKNNLTPVFRLIHGLVSIILLRAYAQAHASSSSSFRASIKTEKLAEDLNIHRIVISSDSKQVVDDIKSGNLGNIWYGHQGDSKQSSSFYE